MPKILEFAVYYGFFHKSDRTDHEQALFRLKSRSKLVKYYDITKGEFKKKNSIDVYKDIITAAKSLQSLRINKGNKSSNCRV